MPHGLRFLAFSLAFCCLNANGQSGPSTLQVTDPVEIRALSALNSRMVALGRRASECAEKKLAHPEVCFCRYPQELEALRKEYQAVIRAYPAWTSRVVSWTDSSSGKPVGYTIAIAHLAPQFGKCGGK